MQQNIHYGAWYCFPYIIRVLFVGRQPYIANVATTLLGMVYCGWFPLHLIFLRNLSGNGYESGLGFVVLMFMSIICTDVGCYYVGTKFGKKAQRSQDTCRTGRYGRDNIACYDYARRNQNPQDLQKVIGSR